ncbi:MAG: hypothetical protein U1E47_01295 [Rivihabitans pingtungensis]
MSRTLTLADATTAKAVSHSLTDSLIGWPSRPSKPPPAARNWRYCGLFASPFPVHRRGMALSPAAGRASVERLQDTARATGLYLGGSYLEARGEHFYNTFALASPPAGQIVGRVGKAHPCSLERAVFAFAWRAR